MTELPMKRVEFYDGALEADDRDPSNPSSTEVWFGDGYRRYPNANGAQSGWVWNQGTAPLTDGSDDTGFRISSAHAADVFVVFDGTVLPTASSMTVLVRYKVRWLDPADTQEVIMGTTITDWQSQSTFWWHASVERDTPKLAPGVVYEHTILIDQAYLDTSPSDVWMNGATPPYLTEPFFTALAQASGKEIVVYLQQSRGAFPYEVDVTKVSVSVASAGTGRLKVRTPTGWMFANPKPGEPGQPYGKLKIRTELGWMVTDK